MCKKFAKDPEEKAVIKNYPRQQRRQFNLFNQQFFLTEMVLGFDPRCVHTSPDCVLTSNPGCDGFRSFDEDPDLTFFLDDADPDPNFTLLVKRL